MLDRGGSTGRTSTLEGLAGGGVVTLEGWSIGIGREEHWQLGWSIGKVVGEELAEEHWEGGASIFIVYCYFSSEHWEGGASFVYRYFSCFIFHKVGGV